MVTKKKENDVHDQLVDAMAYVLQYTYKGIGMPMYPVSPNNVLFNRMHKLNNTLKDVMWPDRNKGG